MSPILQAGAIAVRHRHGAPEVLLVRAKHDPSHWVFPKGHIDPEEDAPTAAVRELREEGGVVGRAAEQIGVSTFTRELAREQEPHVQVQVTYYLVWYVDDSPADEDRETAWLSFDEARARLTFADARAYVDVVESLIAAPRRPTVS